VLFERQDELRRACGQTRRHHGAVPVPVPGTLLRSVARASLISAAARYLWDADELSSKLISE